MAFLNMLLAVSLFWCPIPQESDETGEPEVESPCCQGNRALPWTGYNQGVQWTQPPEAAFAKARKEGKPVMLVDFVGDMDMEGC